MNKANEIVVSALSAAASDPINNLCIPNTTTPGNKVRDISVLLLKLKDSAKFELTCRHMLDELVSFMVGNLAKNSDLEIMWKNVHQYATNSSSRSSWLDVCLNHVDVNSQEFVSLLHFIVMFSVKSVMLLENDLKKKDGKQPESKECNTLSTEEQEILSYVAGYLVFSLKRKYKRIQESGSSKAVAVAALQLLTSLEIRGGRSIESKTFLDFTRKWMEKVNRGGLVQVNDAMFIFVRTIENVVRSVLNVNLMRTYKGEDLRDVLEKELNKSVLIDVYWEAMSRAMPNKELGDCLKTQFIAKWVDIRARSFVNTYVQIVKHKLNQLKAEKNKSSVKLSSKSEPAMRKKLT